MLLLPAEPPRQLLASHIGDSFRAVTALSIVWPSFLDGFEMSLQEPMPSEESLVAAGLGVILMFISLLALSKTQRMALRGYLWSCLPNVTRGRRMSTSKTPPRSLSPEKKVLNNAPGSADYKEIFPPSSCEALKKAAESLPAAQRKKLNGKQIGQEEFRKNVIPFTADYKECGPSTYTPMEVSIEEIKALGDFPNYSELSGVALPEAYKDFDIKKALPRPYRPFRWAYHQTMCRFHPPF